jgi:hypothetical protein
MARGRAGAVARYGRRCRPLTVAQFWQINRDGTPVAYFYLDPYSRPHEKRQVLSCSPAIFQSCFRFGQNLLAV